MGKKILLLLIVGMLMMNLASAELIKFDNVKTYDAIEQKVTIENTFGLGRTIADVKLNTPLEVRLIAGYNKIAEIEVTSYEDYTNALKEIKFYNANTMKEITPRKYEYKVKSYEEIEVSDYKKVCSSFVYKNATEGEVCDNVLIGTHKEVREKWTTLSKTDFIKDEKITLGIFTEVKAGDYIEWIPNSWFGVDIEEWAFWIGVTPTAYWKMNEVTNGTNATDSSGNARNLANAGNVDYTTGKLGNTAYFSAQYERLTLTEDASTIGSFGTNNFTIAFWLKTSATSRGVFHTGYSWCPVGAVCVIVYQDKIFFEGTGSIQGSKIITDNKWKRIVLVREGTGAGQFKIYINGSLDVSGNMATNLNNASIISLGGLVGGDYNTPVSYLDDFQIFNGYAWTSTDVIADWNDGDGREANTDLTNPSITLNSPENYLNSSVSTISFNFTGYIYNEGEQIDSITLYVDNEISETNTTNMANGTTYFITKALSSGYHNWSVSITGTNETSRTSAVRFFNITIYSPDVTLTSPIAYYNTSNPTINFEAEVTDDFEITNVSLYLDGALNETNSSGVNGTYEFTKTLSEGEHYWSILAYDNDSNPTQSGNRYFTIDLTPPILSTTGVTDKYNSTLPINLTWSLFNADANSEKCWYYTSENITNITIICNSSTITNFTSEGNKTIYYFGNDSSGNLASGSSTLFIGYYPYTQSVSSTDVGSGNAVTFTLYVNGTDINSLWPSTNATIMYNGSTYNYNTVDRSNQNYTKFTRTIYTTIGNTTGANTPYNWSYSIRNTTAIPLNVTTTTQQIRVYLMSVYECTAGSRYILNASIKDEGLNSLINASLNPTTIEINIMVSSRYNTSATWNFSKTWINNNTIYVCVPPNVLTYSDYKVDWIIGYKADGYVQEFYYMDNGTIDNTNYFNSYTTNPISLMDLKLTDSTTFLFDFKDEDNLEVDDAIIHVYRKYIGDGVFREVERAEQDDNGETHVHLVEEDVIYYFMVTQYGNIIYTSTNYNAKCLDTPCQISLTAGVNFIEFPTDYDEYNGTLFSITSNKTTRTATLLFSSDQSRTINFSVFKIEDNKITYIDTSSETGTTGSITLSIPYSSGNISYFASIFQDGTFVKSEWIDMRLNARDKFGSTGAILGGLMILALIFMAISEGVILIIIAVVGIIIIGAMQIVELSWLSIISIICAGALIVWKLSQGGRR